MIEQLRPGDAEQEQRRVPSEIGDVVDEVEERRLRPLEVVEDENEWLLSCHPLEDAAGLERDLVPVGPEVDLAGERLDLGERPVRDPLPVGQAATGEQRCVDAVLELSNEPRLPDPGGSEQRELVGNSLGDGMVVGALELGELVFPADQGRVESARDELRALDETDEPERCDRFRLPLGVQWIGRLRLDCVSNEPVRGCAEQRLTRRSALLQPGGDVDGVPDRERLALAGHDLARVDADAALDPDAPVAVQLLVELGQRSPHVRSRANGA